MGRRVHAVVRCGLRLLFTDINLRHEQLDVSFKEPNAADNPRAAAIEFKRLAFCESGSSACSGATLD